jgi:hypothetical protein
VVVLAAATCGAPGGLGALVAGDAGFVRTTLLAGFCAVGFGTECVVELAAATCGIAGGLGSFVAGGAVFVRTTLLAGF